MTITITDHQVIDASASRLTSAGYLVAEPRVARTGIQIYDGAELGRPDLKQVRVFRPENEVFSVDTLKSFASQPLTLNHPSEPVTSKNWRDLAVGHTGEEVLRDGDFIRVPLIVMDQSVIDQIKAGKVELSWGYTADIAWTSGLSPDGAYDAIHTNIRGNHLAIVDRARGGPQLRIGDQSMKTVVIDGVSCQVEDTAAGVIEKAIGALQQDKDRLTRELADAKKGHEAVVAERDTVRAERDTVKAQLTDALDTAKLDARVAHRAGIIAKAKAIMANDKFVTDGKSNETIEREVVQHVVGDAVKDWSNDQVRASFLTLREPDTTGNRTLVRTGVSDSRDEAYNGYTARLRDAWRQPTTREGD